MRLSTARCRRRAEKLRRHDRVEAGLHHPPRLEPASPARSATGIRYTCLSHARSPRFIPRLKLSEPRTPAHRAGCHSRSVPHPGSPNGPVRSMRKQSLPRFAPCRPARELAPNTASHRVQGECRTWSPRAPGARGRRTVSVELDAAIAPRAEHSPADPDRRLLRAGELPEIAARRLAVVVHNDDQVRMLEHASSSARSKCSSDHWNEPSRRAARERRGNCRAAPPLRVRRCAEIDDAPRARRRGKRYR